MGEWKECRLSDIADIIPGFAFKSKEFGNKGVDIVKIKDINPPVIDFSDTEKVDISHYLIGKLDKYKLSYGDFVIAMTGATIGKIGRMVTDKLAYINQRVAKIVPRKDVIKSYVYYAILADEFQQFIQNNIDSQSAQENISGTSIGRYKILLPPPDKQQHIVSVLSCLDEKINLLNRQNATLEKMAEIVFRQWFVEEAKEDWKEGVLTDVADFLNGLVCQKVPAQDAIKKLPVLKIRELSHGITSDTDWATSDVAPEYIVESGDVIFAWSASLMVKIWNGERCILNQHLFKVTSDCFPKWFFLMWCKFHLDEFKVIATSHATTMGHIKRKDLDSAKVIIPTQNRLDEMTEKMQPLIDKIICNNNQIRTLTRLRDTLLTKLMNGEITVE